MSIEVDFVKGHCGWDVVTLLLAGQVPPEQELESALKIVSAPLGSGLEVGFMAPGRRANEIRLRMVSATTKDWISMCGGMTQVIGKALVETFLGDALGIDTRRSSFTVDIETGAGCVPIQITVQDGAVTDVTTLMDTYVSHTYRSGIAPVVIDGVPFLRVGDYAVLNMIDLEKAHPELDFTRRAPGPHLDAVNGLLRRFAQLLGLNDAVAMLFDDRPEGPGQYRVFPRFWSEDLVAAQLPWEFQCGTGSIAVAIALAHLGRLPFAADSGIVVLEWGSARTTPDPYGIRTSQLELQLHGNRLHSASFSHSVVEILAQGRLMLPNY